MQPYSAAQTTTIQLAHISAPQLPETPGNLPFVTSKRSIYMNPFSFVSHLHKHASFVSLQYVSKNNSELHQRAIPKQAQVLKIVDDRDDSIERQVQRIPAIEQAGPDSVKPPELSDVKLVAEDVQTSPPSAEETPHVQVETDETKEARLDKQWKKLKVDVADLPSIYSRLTKIKLTGMRSLCCNFALVKEYMSC